MFSIVLFFCVIVFRNISIQISIEWSSTKNEFVEIKEEYESSTRSSSKL